MSSHEASKSFCEYLKAMPGHVADHLVRTIDTAQAMKLGCQEVGLEVSDEALLRLSAQLIQAWEPAETSPNSPLETFKL